MVKINLVYATYAGVNQHSKKRVYDQKNLTLQIALRQYALLNHNLSQITIMKADIGGEKLIEGYYDLENVKSTIDCDVIEHDVRNFGFSNGQWLEAYKIYKDQFDYFLFLEDDYTMSIDDFDEKLLEIYQEKFPDNIGLLCNLVQGRPKNPDYELPEHYDGFIFISNDTLNTLFNHEKWMPDPIDFIENMDNSEDIVLGRLVRGGRDQVCFSLLFTKIGIPMVDVREHNVFLYWDDYPKHNNGYIYIFDQPMTTTSTSKRILSDQFNDTKLVDNAMSLPIQLARKCILVLSMHRSGSSMTSGCLYHMGIDCGLNMAQVKDSHNEKGYFENMTILHLNEKILKNIGTRWDDVKPIDRNHISKMMRFKNELKNAIKAEYSRSNLFFIKDPRIILLYPLYQAALRELNITIYYIRVARNNDEIVRSLEKAQRVPPSKGLELCNKYKHMLTSLLTNKNFIIVKMIDVIHNPIDVMQNIQKYINIKLLNDDKKEKILEFVDGKLKHF